MDFLSYRETGHIGGLSGKGHIRALDIRGIRLYREISHVCLGFAFAKHWFSHDAAQLITFYYVLSM